MFKVIKESPDATFTWIDMVDPKQEELNLLINQYQIHQHSVEDILQPEHLPKFENTNGLYFIIARYHDAESNKSHHNLVDVSRKMAIFYKEGLIITVHRKPYLPYEQLINQLNASNNYEVLCQVLSLCLNSYEQPNNKLDEEIDFYESRIFLKKRIPDLLKNLYLIKRQLYLFRKISNLSSEIITKVELLDNPKKFAPQYQDLKDLYTKIDTQIESNYNDIQNLLNIYLSISSQKTNEVMRTLTVFTAFFLPITFIAGVYGMNFINMPELHQKMGYPAALGLMVLVTIAIYGWFKRKGWM